MAKGLNGKVLPKGITLRKDGRYMAQITYSGDRYVLYDRNLKEIQAKISDLRYELGHGIYAKEDNITVLSWFTIWLKVYKEPLVKSGTIEVYQNSFDSYIKKPLGNKKLKDIRAEVIQKLYNALKKQGYAKKTIELVSVVLSGLFKQAYKNKIIRENPVPLATLPKMINKKSGVMTVQEQQTFTDYSKDSYFSDLYVTALASGMRSGELRGLEWSNIDFENKTIQITGTLVYIKGVYYKGTPKTLTSSRDIPMLDSICVLLTNRKEEQENIRLQMGGKWKQVEGLENLVFTTETGYPINRDRLKVETNNIINKIQSDNIKIKHITPHMMRHTFASRCIDQGMKPHVLKTILGHEKLSTTMDLYVHISADTKAVEMQRIAPLFP